MLNLNDEFTSFNSKLRDEFLNGEIFYSLKEVQVLAERWRVCYKTVRPRSLLGYQPPAPEVWHTNNKKKSDDAKKRKPPGGSPLESGSRWVSTYKE